MGLKLDTNIQWWSLLLPCAQPPIHHCNPGTSVPLWFGRAVMKKGSKRQDWLLKAPETNG